jgi:hypothetical protein
MEMALRFLLSHERIFKYTTPTENVFVGNPVFTLTSWIA